MTSFGGVQQLTGFIVPVGNGAVGKTSVARVLDLFSRGEVVNEVVLQNLRKTKNLEFEYITTRQIFSGVEYAISLQFLVPPGQKHSEGDSASRSFEQVIDIYRSIIRRVDIVLFTYDLTNHESFHDLAFWVDSVDPLINDLTHFILLGTHLDRTDYTEITKEEIDQGLEYLRKELLGLRPSWKGECTHLEVSSLSGENLNVLLRYLAGSLVSIHKMRS